MVSFRPPVIHFSKLRYLVEDHMLAQLSAPEWLSSDRIEPLGLATETRIAGARSP